MIKIPVRVGQRANSLLIAQSLMEQLDLKNSQSLRSALSEDQILKLLYNEEIKFDDLMHEYRHFLEGEKSAKFEWGYLIKPQFVLCVGPHINFCHLDAGPQMFPWHYTNRGIYLADTLWRSDEEIIQDINSLSTAEFLMKYW